MSEHHLNIHALENQLKEIDKTGTKVYEKLRRMRQHTTIKITDHAILRYLERVKGMDMESIFKAIITDDVIKYYHQFGDGEFPIDKGSVRVVIKDGCIVTVNK